MNPVFQFLLCDKSIMVFINFIKQFSGEKKIKYIPKMTNKRPGSIRHPCSWLMWENFASAYTIHKGKSFR